MALKVRVILYLMMLMLYFMYQMIRYNVNISVVAIAHTEANITMTDHRALILGSFYWCCWMTELFGGVILEKFGCRNLLTISIVINALLSFAFPAAYYLHPIFAAVIRAIQGIALGILWPAVAWLTAKWIPRNERNKFMTSYHGLSLGTSFTNLTGGLIIDSFGWPFVFYGTGIMCVIWGMLWWPNVYDGPRKHPRITKEELDYIEQHVQASGDLQTESNPTPWLEIAKSKPVWALNFLFFAMHWFNVTLATQTPAYLDTMHSVHIKTNGYLSSLPDIAKIVTGVLSPLAVDYTVDKKMITLEASRKLSGVVNMLLPTIFLVLLAFFGKQSVDVAATIIILAVASSGFGASTVMANIVDVSPHHAGTIVGILKTTTIISGVFCPLAAQLLLENDKKNWYRVFSLCSAVMIFACIIFVSYFSNKVQPWDCRPNIAENKKLMEMKQINGNDPDKCSDKGKGLL